MHLSLSPDSVLPWIYWPLWPNGISHIEQTGTADRTIAHGDKPSSKVRPDGGLNIHGIAHPFLVVEVADSQGYEEAIAKEEHFLHSKVRGRRVCFVIVIDLVRKSWKQPRHENTGYDDTSGPEDKDDNETRSEQIDIDLPLQEQTVQDGIYNVEEHIIVTDTTAPLLQSNKRIVDHLPGTSAKRHRFILLTSSPPAAIPLGTKDVGTS